MQKLAESRPSGWEGEGGITQLDEEKYTLKKKRPLKLCALCDSICWSNRELLKNGIIQGFIQLVASQIFQEMSDQSLFFIVMATGGVRRDQAIRGGPERVIGGQGFGIGDIEIGRPQMAIH